MPLFELAEKCSKLFTIIVGSRVGLLTASHITLTRLLTNNRFYHWRYAASYRRYKVITVPAMRHVSLLKHGK